MSEAAPEVSPSASTSPFAMRSPIDGEALDAVEATPLSDIADIVTRARDAQAKWAALTPYERVKALLPVRNRILDRAERFANVVGREVGKPEVEVVLSEVLPSADVVDYWADKIEELLDPEDVVLDPLSYPGKRGVLYRDPRGVIALVTPWNYPVALPLRSLLPALLAGNAVIFKPSEISPRSGALVADLFEGLLPAGVLTIVQGGGDAGAALSSADVDLVIFTGSVATGRKVAHACAERLSPCALELGGKDAAIVLADANLDRAANGVVWGALTNAGQNCAAIERVYVEKKIADAFSNKVLELVKNLPAKDVGPLTTDAQRSTVVRHIDDAKESGGKLLAGGEKGDKGYAYSPTVVAVDKDDSALMKEETFGPVIPIAIVENADEAIARANASRYGLTASIWTKKVRVAEEMAKRLRAGVVTINNHAFTGALPSAPWSGHGETGYGITNSPLALDAMTRPRFVLIDKNRAKRELWWYPYTDTLKTIGYAFCVLRSKTSGIFRRIGALFTLVRAVPKRLIGG